METKTVHVPNIGCNGCVNTIKLEVSDIPGVVNVDGQVAEKQVTVQWEAPATWQNIEAKMREIDYAPASTN